jgi:hypothetical protein
VSKDREGAMKKLLPIVSLSLSLAAACGGEPTRLDPLPIDQQPPMVQQARRELVTALDLHTNVIQRSCSPAGGVCHNGREYPDLRTTGSMIAALSKPCNSDRIEDPGMVFDGCEPEADELLLLSGGEWRTKIGYLGIEEYDFERGNVYRRMVLEAPAPRTVERGNARIMRGSQAVVNLPANFEIEQGSTEGRIIDTYNLEYSSIQALGKVRSGDPNGNGVFGAGQPWQLIAPGYPDRSYLVGRITAEVPGTRMPLANRPLSDAEYVAIICWIETMSADPAPHDRIDYDNCNFARNPRSYQIVPISDQ